MTTEALMAQLAERARQIATAAHQQQAESDARRAGR
jgi:hypothetical protein